MMSELKRRFRPARPVNFFRYCKIFTAVFLFSDIQAKKARQ